MPAVAADASEITALLNLLNAIGVPGLLGFLSLPLIMMGFLFWIIIRQNNKSQSDQQKQSDERWNSLLKTHKEERDRDFDHLKELMGSLAGLYNQAGEANQQMGVMDRTIQGLATGINSMPEMFRGVHSRLDVMIINIGGKGNHGHGNSGLEGPASNRQG